MMCLFNFPCPFILLCAVDLIMFLYVYRRTTNDNDDDDDFRLLYLLLDSIDENDVKRDVLCMFSAVDCL